MEHESKNCANIKSVQAINVEPKMHKQKLYKNETSMSEYRSSKSGNWMVNTDVCYNCVFTKKKHTKQIVPLKKNIYAYDSTR